MFSRLIITIVCHLPHIHSAGRAAEAACAARNRSARARVDGRRGRDVRAHRADLCAHVSPHGRGARRGQDIVRLRAWTLLYFLSRVLLLCVCDSQLALLG